MRKLIIILLFISCAITAKSQTPVAGKWKYFFITVDSAFAIPGDTLASSPIRSIAIKNNTLYYKLSSGIWSAISGGSTVLAGNGIYKDGDSIKLGGTPLTEATTVNLNGNDLFLTGVGDGTLNDSCIVLDVASNAIRKVAQSAVGSWTLDGSNNLAPKTFSGNQISISNKALLITGITGSIPTTAVGTHFYWYPAKKAFRAGEVFGTGTWSDANTGVGSFAFGDGVQVSGGGSAAFGVANVVGGQISIVGGSGANITGNYSFSLGSGASQTAQHSFGFGSSPVVSAIYGVGWGNGAAARGVHSWAFGNASTARDSFSLSWGNGVVARNKYQFVFGNLNDTTSTIDMFTLGRGSVSARKNIFSVDIYGRILTDSLDNGNVSNDEVVLWNRFSRQFRKLSVADVVGIPALPSYRIAYGSLSGSMSSSALFKYNDTTQTISAINSNYSVSSLIGDSNINKPAVKMGVFYGNSLFAGTTIEPYYLRPSTQVANRMNINEWNRSIGGTRMAALISSDSSMFNRIYTIPSGVDYLFFEYGTNDALSTSVTESNFKNSYLTVIDTAIARNPTATVVIVSIGKFLHVDPIVQARNESVLQWTKDVATLRPAVKFVNMYEAMNENGGAALLTQDSIHITERGSEVWANAIIEVIGGAGSLRANGYVNTNNINIYQTKNPLNAPLITGFDASFPPRPVFEVRGKYNGSNTESMGIGLSSLSSITSGLNNMAVGIRSMASLTTGSGNTAIGYNTLNANISGGSNTAIGMNVLRVNTANENTGIGRDVLYSNTTGTQNTGIGYYSLRDNATGSLNTGVGYYALNETTGSNNTAIGASALRNNTTGATNTAIGVSALFSNATGSGNTGVGYRALRATTGSENTGIGIQAGDSLTTGIRNAFISYQAGFRTKDGQLNTFIGYKAGINNFHGSYNTIIGGYNGKDTSLNQQVVLSDGEGDVSYYADMNTGFTGINTVEPTQALDVNGKIRARTISNQVAPDSIAVITDGVIERTSISSLRSALGIGDVLSVTPTSTLVSNVSTVTPTTQYYQVINGSCDVWGYVTVTATATGQATFRLSIPVASTFSDLSSMSGSFNTNAIVDNGSIYPDNVNNEPVFSFVASTTGAVTYRYRYKYKITPP